MSILNDIGNVFLTWVDVVTQTAGAARDRLRSARLIEIVEDEDGGFTIRAAGKNAGGLPDRRVHLVESEMLEPLAPDWAAAFRGAQVELVLLPSRFLFRPLELPARAAEFLDGILRAQIDRLTPWSPGEAAYHWTTPQHLEGERIGLTLVAAARSAVAPLAAAFSGLGAAAVAVATQSPAEGGRVRIVDERGTQMVQFGRLRTALLAIMAVTGTVAVVTAGAAGFLADHYDEQAKQVRRQINERRAVLRGEDGRTGNSAIDLLHRRKQTTPSVVMAIEALSALLPDHTYATEVRIEGDKLQVVGLSRDAPSLIQILEQSPHFARASFFAPTTRGANDVAERFHIEVKMKPHFEKGS